MQYQSPEIRDIELELQHIAWGTDGGANADGLQANSDLVLEPPLDDQDENSEAA